MSSRKATQEMEKTGKDYLDLQLFDEVKSALQKALK